MHPAKKTDTRQINFLNLRQLFEDNREDYERAFYRIASQASFIGGKELEEFEAEFARWVGEGSYSVGCGNGTDAIWLAASALGLPAGSEAIIPAMTFVATAEGLLHAGLTVKLVDVKPGTWLMDLDALEKAITPKTKLIVPVHLYGQMVAMDRVREIADRHGLKVLEDSAQSHGATWKGNPVGFYGDIATYSFFPGKNLGCFGDGGAVLSRNRELVQKTSALAKHGGLKKYEHLQVGYNSRLDTLQAAMLRIKLRNIDTWTANRRQVATWYREKLADLREVQLPVEDTNAKGVYHLFVINVADRVKLQEHLKNCGVETGIHYPLAIHHLPAFKNSAFATQSFPQAEHIAKHGLSLPMCPTLTESDVQYVAEKVWEFYKR